MRVKRVTVCVSESARACARERAAESAARTRVPGSAVLAMLLTVFCAPRDRGETTFALEVSPELELRDFLALCELESGIPAGEIQVNRVKIIIKSVKVAV